MPMRRFRAPFLLGVTTMLTPLAATGALRAAAPAAMPEAAMPEAAVPEPAAPEPAAPEPEALGDVVVTATRVSQSIQRVPISIQALTPEKLSERQVVNFADYVNLLPSVSFSSLGPGRNNVFFRGIASDAGLPTVGVYIDDIPVNQAGRLVDVHIYDVERVEALSGPQGTLFGASSLAGTLRIITKKPSTKGFEAGYDAQVNKFGKGDFGGMLEGFTNIPVTEDIAIRLMGFYKRDGGYIDNRPNSLTYQLGDDDPSTTFTIDNARFVKKDFNTNTEYGGRAAVGIDLSESWSVLGEVTAQKLNAKGAFNFDPRVGDLAVHDYNPTFNRDKWYQAALTIQGKIGDLDLVSSTGWFQRKIENANDYTYYTVTYDNFGPGYESYLQFHDRTSGALIDPTQQYRGNNRYRKFTQEVRLSTPKEWRFRATAGGFYQWQKALIDSDYYIPGLANAFTLSCPTAARVNPAALPACPDGTANVATFRAVKRDAFYLVEQNTTLKDYALFAEASFDIVSNLTATGGIRHFKAENLVYGFGGVRGSAIRAGCAIPFAAERITCVNTNIPYKETGETYRANLTWQITPSKMVYATYSTGFRPGGGNRIAPNNPYRADTLDNYEAGFKTSWGRNFRFNGAVYYEEWKGVQYAVVPFGFQGAGLTVNAGDARVYGIELDADLRLGPVTLSGSGAFNDAKLATDFCNLDPVLRVVQLTSCTGAGVAAAKGTRLPRQPRLKLQGSARYDRQIGAFDAYLQGVIFYQSSSTSNLDTFKNGLLGNTPGFASMDFSIGARRGGMTYELFLQNAFDRRGQLSKNTFCSIEYCADSSRTFPIKPQFFGARVAQRF
ncbi:MAG: TonB-dependent receptor [Sphingomonas fennica]